MIRIVGLLLVIVIISAGYFFFHEMAAHNEENETSNEVGQVESFYLFGADGGYVKININERKAEEKGSLLDHESVKRFLPDYDFQGALIYETAFDAM